MFISISSTPEQQPREPNAEELALAHRVAVMLQQAAPFQWMEQAKAKDEVQQRYHERRAEGGQAKGPTLLM